MCVPDLYTFIKLYGTDQQVTKMTELSDFRRAYLLPIYRKVRQKPQRILRFFGRTDLPPLPVPENDIPRRSSYRTETKVPRKTTSSRYDALDEQDMYHHDLYAYIKVFGTGRQREELVKLRSKTRREHLLPLYRKVLRNYYNRRRFTDPQNVRRFTDPQNVRRYLNKELHDPNTIRDRLTNDNNRRWYNQLTYVFTIDDVQSVIDALERADMTLTEIEKAREEMTRTQRAQFDKLLVDLMRYKRFQRNNTMKLFVKLNKSLERS
jgi:hypothetical protein